MDAIGVLVIGASMRSTMVFDYFEQHPHQGYVTGIYDVIRSKSEYLLDEYNIPDAVAYESLEQAVSDKRVGGVFIGTPDNAHVEPVVKALEAGKHVYCEKPLAITIEDCDAIIEAAQNAETVFYLGMNLRHGPVHDTLHSIVASGKLGRLLAIEANEYYTWGRTYFRRWNRFRKYGGGLWITKACHDFDLLNWFAGGKPVRVFATSSLSHYKPNPRVAQNCRVCQLKDSCPDSYKVSAPEDARWDHLAELTEQATGQLRDLCLYNSEKDTFDNGIALVEYDNDVRASYTLTVVSARNTRQMRLIGTEGTAEGDMCEGTVTLWKRQTEEKTIYDLRERMNSGHGGSDNLILADFFRCCQSGEKPRSSWADGRLSVQLGLGARESCDTGKPVNIE